jgi:mono/diheme cytochrome c family protein
MPRLLAFALLGLLTVFTAGGARRGCRDAWHSASTLRYPRVRDMRHTVALLPQAQAPLAPDSASVPLGGIDRDLGRDVLARELVNPTPPAELAASVRRGEAKFARTCMLCHGTTMAGNGPVSALFMTAADLLAPTTRQRADGYLYSYIRHGGAVMPAYGAQVTRQEAWDLINYIRHMQKVAPR